MCHNTIRDIAAFILREADVRKEPALLTVQLSLLSRKTYTQDEAHLDLANCDTNTFKPLDNI